jgi:ATP-dependent DNA helicase RecG
MPQQEYERRLLQRAHPQQRWENQSAVRYRIADLDEEEIMRAIRDAQYAGRLESDVMNPVEALRKLNLVENDQPNQAAIVALAKNPLPDYPQCALRMARFRGVTKSEFLDQRQLTGHAFVLLHEAELFLRRHLPVSGRFESGRMDRIDEPLFPPLALREALVNALCHRDYAIYGGAISVAVYDDRLEIVSSGTLPFDLNVDDLKREHESRPRNPFLAELFYRRGFIERWGRGTLKIIEMCRTAGHPEPEFEQRAGDIVVRFLPSGYSPPLRVSHDLTERQRAILRILSDGSPRMANEIACQLENPPSGPTLRLDLSMLRNVGLVESGGHGRGARWWLKTIGKE